MLSHYFTPALSEDGRVLVDRDWVQTLGHFPAWAVEQACSEHVREDTRRPTPAAIKDRTEKAIAYFADELRRRNQLAPEEANVRSINDAGREAAERIMREAGFEPRRFGKGADE